jgi:Tol biopolymer transport system component
VAGDDLDSADRSGVLERLDSWKEIAAYLKRDVTTVRRWEKREGLPVQRHLHEQRDSVYAYKQEIDRWWEGRRSHLADRTWSNGESNGSDHGPPPPARTKGSLFVAERANAGWAVAAALLLSTVALAALLIVRTPGTSDGAERRFSIYPPPATAFGAVSLSPDGRYLAFAATSTSNGGHALLWLRAQDDVTPHAMPDTEGAAFPFWSPASDAIGFFAGGKLWTVRVNGGSPRVVCDAPEGRGGAWNRQGRIVFAPGREGPLFQIAADGGDPVAVTTVDRPKQRGHVWPEFLPDGNRFLYLADSDTPENHFLAVGSLDGAIGEQLFPFASNVAYTRDGLLIFARDRQLLAQPFDDDRLVLSGDPITLVDKVQQPGSFDHKADFAVSDNGVLVYRTRQSPANRLVWHDRVHPRSALVDAPAEYYEPALSPDERQLAVALFDPNPSNRFGYGTAKVRADIWMVDRDTGARSQLTTDPAADWGPVWSPDGRSLVFSSQRRGKLELFLRDLTADHGGEVPLPSEGMNPVAQSWSRDGHLIVFAAFDPEMHTDLWLLPISGDRVPIPLLRTKANEYQGQISPDGRWIAYTSDTSGQEQVYVQSFPSPGPQKWQVSTSGGGDPRWRSDGQELFYIAADRRLMAVPVKPATAFAHEMPVPLFDTGVPPSWYEARNLYDVSRDGSFLFMTPIEDDRTLPFTIVLDWRSPDRN